MKSLLKNNTFIFFLLYLICIFLRIITYDSEIIQADELHWLERSQEILKRLGSDPLAATSHLGQPGIVPAGLMAFGIAITHFLENIFEWNSAQIDYLLVCRIVVIVFGSLLIPLVYVLASRIFNQTIALVSAVLLMFDPRFIANVRIAHLDIILAVLVLLTIYFYYLGYNKNSKYKLIAGVFWGLSIATKPTAILLLPAFFLITTFNSFKTKKTLIEWQDLYAIFIGHLVFVFVYTRLWQFESEYENRLQVKSFFADGLYNLGNFFHSYYIFILILFLGFITYFLAKKKFKPYILLASVLLFSFALFPHIYHNISLFWTWTLGLTQVAHDSLRAEVLSAPGYWTLAYSILPEAIILGSIVAVILLCSETNRSYLPSSTYLLLIILFWIFGLSFSDKQSWRYVLPVIGPIYILATLGIYLLIKNKQIRSALFVVAIALQIFIFFSWYPNYQLYYNKISGGLVSASHSLSSVERPSQRETVDYLLNQTGCIDCNVSALDLSQELNYILMKRAKDFSKFVYRPVQFRYFKPLSANYVVENINNVKSYHQGIWNHVLAKSTFKDLEFHDVNLTRIYKVPATQLNKPMNLKLEKVMRHTGSLVKKGNKYKIIANVKKHSYGNLFFTHGLNFAPGEYYLKLKLKLKHFKKKDISKQRIVSLRINDCYQDLYAEDFKQKVKKVKLTCEHDGKTNLRPEIVWHTKVDVQIDQIKIGDVQKT